VYIYFTQNFLVGCIVNRPSPRLVWSNIRVVCLLGLGRGFLTSKHKSKNFKLNQIKKTQVLKHLNSASLLRSIFLLFYVVNRFFFLFFFCLIIISLISQIYN
jgi:hypothetical protein